MDRIFTILGLTLVSVIGVSSLAGFIYFMCKNSQVTIERQSHYGFMNV